MRGGKYSVLEGGTRIPFIISWPGRIRPKVSDALISQIDMLASFSAFLKQPVPVGEAGDSENMMDAFLGTSDQGRSVYIEQGGALAIVRDGWKLIFPNKGPALEKLTNIETGNAADPQLYDLKNDIGEKNNLAAQYPEKVKVLTALLSSIRQRK